MTIHIAPLRAEDLDRWNVLACGYKTFYKATLPDEEYDKTWQRLLAQDGISGLGATQDGQLVGIAHYLFHTTVWAQNVCYLQDLFVDQAARGQGAGAMVPIDQIPVEGAPATPRNFNPWRNDICPNLYAAPAPCHPGA